MPPILIRAFLLAALICGCRSAPAGKGASFGPVRLGGTDFFLLPPGCIETPLDMLQRMSGAYGDRRFQMNAWVQADENAVTVELFNDFGTGMGFLAYDGIALRLDSAYFPPELKPEYAAADFQLCFYREDALRSALRPLRLEVSREGETETRRIWEKTRLIAEIEKLPGEIRYINHERGYSYTIRGDFPR